MNVLHDDRGGELFDISNEARPFLQVLIYENIGAEGAKVQATLTRFWEEQGMSPEWAAAMAALPIGLNKQVLKNRGSGGSANGMLRYEIKPQDMDWRGTGKTHNDALDAAFAQTGFERSEFVVTRWGRDANGKSFPAEYKHQSGAEVNIDWAHSRNGPDAPHVGWQTAGKRGDGGALRGHIILDSIPYNR